MNCIIWEMDLNMNINIHNKYKIKQIMIYNKKIKIKIINKILIYNKKIKNYKN